MRCVGYGAVIGLSLLAWRAAAQFTEIAVDAGVDYLQWDELNDALSGASFSEMVRMSGAVAAADYDDDGWTDLFVTRLDDHDLLFRNDGDGTFSEVSEEAGFTDSFPTNSAMWFDCDLDGDLDLLVNTVGGYRLLLYINDGHGRFTDEAEARGIDLDDGARHTQWSLGVGDFDRDGYPDFATVEWGIAFITGPLGSNHTRLFRNRGGEHAGFFEDITEDADYAPRDRGASNVIFGFAATFVDLDDDGATDIAIAGDFGTSTMLWNEGGSLVDGTFASGLGSDENGMGSTFGDYDSDGDLDWFITSIWDPENTCEGQPCNWGVTGNRLFRNDGIRQFTDVTDEAGVREGFWGWGAAFFDFDNDADLDLTMTNGVDFPSNQRSLGQYVEDPMLFWINDGDGTFTERAQELGVTDVRSGKGLAYLDFDRDGDLDFFVTNNGDHPSFYRNDTDTGNDWIRMRFEHDGKPYVPWNAQVEVELTEDAPPQFQEVGVNAHFLGQSETTLHFGLGAALEVPVHEVRVTYPWDESTQVLNDLDRNQVHVIEVPSAPAPHYHDADYAHPYWQLSLTELLRIIQLFSVREYTTDPDSEDGFRAGPNGGTERYHASDYAPADHIINLAELLRAIQLYQSNAFRIDATSEDGYAPGAE